MRIDAAQSPHPGAPSDPAVNPQDAWERSAHRRCIAPRDEFESSSPQLPSVNFQSMLQLMARR